MNLSFANKTAVVTGGARNIGLAIARAFLKSGAKVVVADLSPPPDDSGLLFCKTDVSCEQDVVAMADFAEQHCGGMDVLVNNAGICAEAAIAQTELEQWERVMAVNVRGVFLCAKHSLPLLRKSRGAIVNIGSIEGHAANPAHGAYAASKGAVHSLTRNIALEFGAYGVRCNAVAPGWIETPFNENFLSQFPDPEAAREAVRKLHPAGRAGTADDIANAVLWLASEQAAFATGQVYVQDGGRSACLPLPPFK